MEFWGATLSSEPYLDRPISKGMEHIKVAVIFPTELKQHVLSLAKAAHQSVIESWDDPDPHASITACWNHVANKNKFKNSSVNVTPRSRPGTPKLYKN